MKKGDRGISIALDAMGGDYAPGDMVKGAVLAAESRDLELILVGPADIIGAELAKCNSAKLSIRIVHADDVVPEGANPALAVRQKPNSSIAVAARMVKTGEADGLISAGPTGAIVAAAVQYLGMVEGIERPVMGGAIFDTAPDTVVFDCGVNMDCKPYHLLTFAIIGHVYCRKLLGIDKPAIGLLNIGTEEGKGNQLTREAYPLLMKSGLNFIGNIEGNQMMSGRANVLVCDAFVGNILFKFAGSLGLFHDLPEARGYNQGGGLVFGVNGIVRKLQGASRAHHVAATIHQTKDAIKVDFIGALKLELTSVANLVNI